MEAPIMAPPGDPGVPPSAPPVAAAPAPAVVPGKLSEKDAQKFKARIEKSKAKRGLLLPEWRTNVDYRRGKQFDSASDEDRVAMSTDWSQTKAKQSQLFSQVPTVALTPKHPLFAPAVPVFAKKLNDTIARAKVGAAMDECLPDVINAAGIAAVVVGFETRQELKKMPQGDTLLLGEDEKEAALKSAQFESVPQVHDSRFYCRRISPGELLWPSEFRQSDFDEAPWMGYSGKAMWSDAQNRFGLTDDQKRTVCGDSSSNSNTTEGGPLSTSANNDASTDVENDVVEFDELFYWAYRFDSECYSFSKIRRLVFVKGIDKPVIDEDYTGQKPSADNSYYIGVTKLPIRVLTLTYITDEAVPPSDSAIGRPQVDELIKSRSQKIQQRDFSTPMRWFDVNRTDPAIVDALMKGTWQGMIPVNGDGTKALGEIARASFPPENFEIERQIKSELQDSWQIGANQNGNFNEGQRSASEAQIVQQNFQTRIGYERARVASFFCGIAEVLGGLLAMFGDFTTPDIGQDGQQRMQAWDSKAIGNCFVYDIRTDSTVLLDAHQRMQKLSQFLDLTVKSGMVDPEPVLREMAALSTLDPDLVVKKPEKKGPEPPSATITIDADTVRDQIVLATMVKAGYAPGPQDLEAAKQILIESVQAPKGAGAPPDAHLPPGGGDPNADPNAPPQGAGLDTSTAPPIEDPNPKWNLADRINKRMNDGSGH